MTRRRLFRITLWVMVLYLLALAAGAVLRLLDSGPGWVVYSTYKDMVPLIIAIPAAFLAYSFQRRNSYVQALRQFWSQLVKAVQGARMYTDIPNPSWEQYSKVLSDLSIVIDEARAVFENLPAETNPKGWYPFEPIKEIYNDVRSVGYGREISAEARVALCDRIEMRWKAVRRELLREFDRDVPTYHHAWYMNVIRKSREKSGDRK